MSRRFAPITVADLKAKIDQAFGDGEDFQRHMIPEVLGKDLKVEFDLENFEDRHGERAPDDLLGYHATPHGLTFWGFLAGGDWEMPVFAICYFDGKKLRGYVPTGGNPWNRKTKQAYGNAEDEDGDEGEHDWPAIAADIAARLTPAPAKPAKAVRKGKSLAPVSLRDRVKALRYYGPDGDEASELFFDLCRLCYKLNDGPKEWAEQVYEMARQHAEATRENPDGWPAIEGVWG